MCIKADRKAALAKKYELPEDATDEAIIDQMEKAYDGGEPAFNKVSADLAEVRAEVLRLTAAVAEKEKKVMELSGAKAPRVIDPEALKDRAANYRDRLALMVDRGQISSEVAQRVIAAGLTDENPSVLMLSGAADLGGKRPAEFVINLLDGMVPVKTNNAVERAAGTAPPPQYPTLNLSGAGGGDQTQDDPAAEAAEYEARQLKARGLAPAGK